jgi:hypothetical protein
MALALGAIILNVPKTGPAAEFWSQALGFTADHLPVPQTVKLFVQKCVRQRHADRP